MIENGSLLLFDYRTEALFGEAWNWFDLQARGLVVDRLTGEIIALPFPKFFNWGEGGRTSIAPIESATNKIDGSLAIIYWYAGQWRVNTRGSFTSSQAKWAADFLTAHFDLSQVDPDLTLLCEIVYPENRVVVSYGDQRALYLIGVRNRKTLADWLLPTIHALAESLGFPVPVSASFTDIDQVIDNLKDADLSREGWVVRFQDGQRFKFKSLTYLTMHKFLSGVSFRWVLDAIKLGVLDAQLSGIPDEFLGEIYLWRDEIESRVLSIEEAVELAWQQRPTNVSRADYAQWVRDNHKPLSSYLFLKLDNRPLRASILQNAFRDKL